MHTETSFSQFVDWFRNASPYIHAHRGHTFVISFAGEAVQQPKFRRFIHDVALLNSLGIRLVLVYGIRPQVERCLQQHGLEVRYINELRITTESALPCVKAACGEISLTIQSNLSMGLTNSPTIDNAIRVASGNFITARPVGVRDGVDYCYTGEVRRVDTAAITRELDANSIVLIHPIGYSPTGEIFNLLAEDVATSVAIALQATKWICLTETVDLIDDDGQPIRQLTLLETQQWLPRIDDFQQRRQLKNAVRACQGGVKRVHLISQNFDGAILLELFSRDGIGTLISADPFENMRNATIEDVGGILQLIQPLEQKGILVRRSREKLENEIAYFVVQERDGMVISCAALYPYMYEKMAEIGCFAVHDKYRGEDRGDALLEFLIREAKQLELEQVFVLTTHTADWFRERGFVPANLDILPGIRRDLYNYQRKSKVFVKHLTE